MNLEILNIDEFNLFLESNPLNNFLQSPLMDEVTKLKNQEIYYVGIKKDEKIICACRLIAIPSRFGKKYFYSPRGFIMDFNDTKLLNIFTNEIKKFIKSKGGFELIIDPNILYKERDINGDLINGGFDNSSIVDNLNKLGYKHLGFTKGTDISRQVRWIFSINIKNKSEDEVFANFKPNTRNLISKASKSGIKIEELEYEDLSKFKEITENTADRIGFSDKSLEYYQTMYKNFVPNKKAKFILASINLKEYLNSLNDQKESIKNELEIMKSSEITSKSAKSKYNNLNNDLNNLLNKIDKINELIKTDGEIINLSSAMFITYGKEVIYAFSGNIDKYMSFNAQYLIQWEMIKYAIKNKFEKYNFYGISGIFDKNDPNYGVYEFKRGFNGQVEEYIGEFTLPISFYYYINKLIKRIKK